jgi:SAM-dependent methyltransferase
MTSLVNALDRWLYPQYSSNWDDALLRQRILACLAPNKTVLDLGAGAGILPQMNFRDRAARVCGVDLDPRVVANPMLDEGRVADGARIPYDDASFDIVFADNVVEHLDDPLAVFREVHRVLKAGGVFIFKTPNKWHYMPTIARITPYRFHRFFNRLRGRHEVDTFPTRYRANTVCDVRWLAMRAGFVVESVELIEGRPEYMRVSVPTYVAGAAYERLVNSSRFLEQFRILLAGTLRKV